MKKLLILLALVLTTFTVMAQKTPQTPLLFPTPQKITYTNGVCNISQQQGLVPLSDPKEIKKSLKAGKIVLLQEKVDALDGISHNASQAYRLEISPNIIKIQYTAEEGLKYGMHTLEQLLNSRKEIPCMTISDWPDFEYRGWMDDYSRGPIANEKFRKISETLLYGCNYNYCNYYTEHIFYNPNLPDVAPHPEATLSKDNASLMANLQCFAHFEKTLRIPFYIDMKDSPYNVDPSKEETYGFLSEQIRNVAKAYPHARFFNINCDETEALGSGRAKEYVSKIGAEEAYVQHINRVYDIVKRHDKEVLMWGDIVGKKPEMLEKLPKDMQYIIWSYVPSDSFEEMISPFKKLHDKYGTKFWVASGVSHWSNIFPCHQDYIKNIANLARDGYNAGAYGYMCTAWDDSGESLMSDCMYALLWGAEMAWNSVKPREGQTYEEALKEREEQFRKCYTDWCVSALGVPGFKDYDVASFFYEIGDLRSNPMVGDWYNVSALYDPLLDFYPSKVGEAMLQRCDSVEQMIARMQKKHKRYDLDSKGSKLLEGVYWTNTQAADQALYRLQVTAEKCRLRALMHRKLNGEDVDYTMAMAQYFEHLHKLKLEYLRMWDYECTEYSRNIITDRYDNLGREVLEAEQHVFINTFAKEGKTYVELKALGNYPIYYTLDGRRPSEGSYLYKEPFVLDHSCEIKTVCYNSYGDAVETAKYLLLHKGMGHLQKLNTAYSTYRDTYSAGGDNALLDGEMGSDKTYNDGHWQGYWGQDVDVEMDFGTKTCVNNISLRFMQNSTDWILAPKEIEVYTSKDGKAWTLVRTEHFNPDFRQSGNVLRNDAIRDLKLQTQFLRVVAKNPGKLPEFTPGAGYDSYIFCDEIVVD